MQQALKNLRVLELGRMVAGPYCGKLFADLGAEVIKVERPGAGDEARWVGPFPGGQPHPERSALFLFLNTGKKSITLNLQTPAGIERFKQLMKNVDVLVENYEPKFLSELGLDYEALHILNPRLVMVSISSFGASGPYRDFKAV